MTDIKIFHDDICSLVALLEKLLKVINHSDPSANRMKLVLFDKYKKKITSVAGEIKMSFSWEILNRYLERSDKNGTFAISPENRTVILNRLRRDFEEEFYTKQVLDEFTQEEPVRDPQQDRIRKIRKQIKKNRKIQSKPFVEEDFSEMIRFRNNQREARRSLDKLVRALNKIKPIDVEVQ